MDLLLHFEAGAENVYKMPTWFNLKFHYKISRQIKLFPS